MVFLQNKKLRFLTTTITDLIMTARLERMNSEDFEHVVQPLEDVKEDVEGSEKRDEEDVGEDDVGKKSEKIERDDVKEVDPEGSGTDTTKSPDAANPTYTRIHRQYLSDRVLDTYNISYTVDEMASADSRSGTLNYLIIKRDVPEYEANFFFEATRHERGRGMSPRGRLARPRRYSIARSLGEDPIDLIQGQLSSRLSIEINRVPFEKWWTNEIPVVETGRFQEHDRRRRRHSEDRSNSLDMPFRGRNVLDVAIKEDKPVRLSVNSHELQDELTRLTRVGFSDFAKVILPPWKMLVEYESGIRERLESLKEMLRDRDEKKDKVEDLGKDITVDATPSKPSEERDHVSSAENACQVCLDGPHAHSVPLGCLDIRVAHLQVLVDFMDADLKPVFDLRRKINDGTIQEIAFADLWHLFNPGDLVVSSPYQQAYRIFHTSIGRQKPSSSRWYEKGPNYTYFNIDCFYIDCDPRMLGPIHQTLSIVEYVGKRSISELMVELNSKWVDNMTISPLKMLPDEERKRQIEYLVARGKKLRTLKQGMHKYYDGLDAAQATKDFDDDYLVIRDRSYGHQLVADMNREPDHITSDIIIDGPFSSKLRPIGVFRDIEGDIYETMEKALRGRVLNLDRIDGLDRQYEFSDHVRDYIIDDERAAKYKNDLHLLQVRDSKDEIEDDHYMLLPPTVEAFVLERRQWIRLLVDEVKDIEEMPTRKFSDLVLPDGYEKLLKAVVKNHSSSKETTSTALEKRSDKTALTILLHGPQSTGKRLTAKALASYFQRPIYSINSYDLDTSISAYAGNFEFAEHFRHATKWNAIILVEDADRSFPDPTVRDNRSINCCLFLQELAQHKGIVILTARRKETLDSQLAKHVNVALRYDAWDTIQKENTLAWKQQLARVEREQQVEFSDEVRQYIFEFAREEFRKGYTWNGRDIKNYFDVAIAMMRSDSKSGEEQKSVEVEHLRVAASAVWTCD
ncbi:P-loop containing nucleoside triphosphate hydrolase protein [Rutstroemia sp. NJR-2017a BVV2]|nr:P-loop containing nucleoside triphosphate hydrolase protein [Rutstroemia sp. NJR-2017a BVV2]